MKKLIILPAILLAASTLHGQIPVTFTGIGAATLIDSITATNLTTNQRITFPGNETLILTAHTGIPFVEESTTIGIIYPNPFSGRATFITIAEKPQTVYLSIQNLVGQVVAQTKAFVQPGENEFDLSLETAGIYMVSLTSEQGTTCYKVICTDPYAQGNSIKYLGAGSNNQNNQNNHNNLTNPGLKSSQTGYTLGYTSDEIIFYKCFSGIYTTIVTDSLISSKNYQVEFVPCTDPDGKNYAVVHIGDQTWMAENLAWLPSVTGSGAGSTTIPYYYVCEYYGTSIDLARASAKYYRSGVLYNWEAAITACPSGWHLPSETEWTVFTDYLTNTGYGYGGSGNDIGKSIAAPSVWPEYWKTGSLGNDQASNNRSGFTAFPGGSRATDGGFYSPEHSATFWSSTEVGSQHAWNRGLNYDSEGVFRYSDFKSAGVSVRCLKNGYSAPSARFLANTSMGSPSTIFQFDASRSTDAETDTADLEVRWDWDGDGIWDTGYKKVKTDSHQYTSSGNYPVILEVKDGSGLTGIETKTVIVGDGTFTDSRDGNEYHYKTIGSQTWMIENLAWLPSVSPSANGSETDPYYYVFGFDGISVSDAKSTDQYTTYGVLYNWEAAIIACPEGWHLPGDEEWTTLVDYLGDQAGNKMRESGYAHWPNPNAGATNTSGFTALPFSTGGEFASFWSASEENLSYAWSRSLYFGNDYVGNNYMSKRWSWISVRCLKGERITNTPPRARFSVSPQTGPPQSNFQFDASDSKDTETAREDLEFRWDWNGDGDWDTRYDQSKTKSFQYPDPGVYRVILEVKDSDGLVDSQGITVAVSDGSLTDNRDGREYAYKTIGTQTWMTKNLAYLPAVSMPTSGSKTAPYYYVYDYQGTSVEEAKQLSNYNTYGALYNWEAAKTACPSGWHLPSDQEWEVLCDYLIDNGYGFGGISYDIGKSLASSSGWAPQRYEGTIGGDQESNNSSGFTALPAGGSVEGFYGLGSNAYFWSSSKVEGLYVWLRILYVDYGGVSHEFVGRSCGFSVRCLRN